MPPRHLFLVLFVVTLRTGHALRNALSSNPPLRCCFMEEPPISFQNNRSSWNNGLDGVIRDHLLQHQSYLNWTCSSMLPFNQNGSTDFNAFVSNMEDCTNKSTGQIIDSPDCMCDIGIGGWFPNPDRFGRVTFLPPFAHDRYVVFTHISETTVSGRVWFFLKTFDAKVWICILGLFVMFTFLKLLDYKFEPDDQCPPAPPTTTTIGRYVHYLTKSRPLYRLRKATQSTLMRMLLLSDEHVVTHEKTTRQWFLNMILAAASLFLVLSYEASMTASLVQESIQTRFRSVADLQNCRIDPSETCLLRGGALETYWNNSIATRNCHLRNPPQYFDSYDSLFAAVENGQCNYALNLESVIQAAIRERYCGDFVIVGDPIFIGGLSMLLPIGSNLTQPMSRATLGLHRNETEPSLSKYLNTLSQCAPEMDSKLSFGQLRFFFIILFSFGAIIFLAMVLIPQRVPKQSGCTETAAAREGESPEGKKMPAWDNDCAEARAAALRHDLRHNALTYALDADAKYSRTAPGSWHSGTLWDTRSRAGVLTSSHYSCHCATNPVALTWSSQWLAFASSDSDSDSSACCDESV